MDMTSPQQRTTSEWVGFRGRIGGWYLNSGFRRLSEILFLGDLHTRFDECIENILSGNETVLDVGAGSGYFSLPIAKRLSGGKVICVDLSSQMLEQLKRKARAKSVLSKIEVRQGSAYSLDIRDSVIDVAMSNGVFHELSQPQKAIGEIRRVLKSEGFVIISDFRNTEVGKRIAAAHREEDHGPFSPEELKSLLEGAGFSNVEVEVIRHWVLGIAQKH